MGSKASLSLGLFLAVFLMISSEVIARELAETSNSVKPDSENEVHIDGNGKYYYGINGDNGGGGDGYKRKRCHYICCKKTIYGCKKYCCSYAEHEAMGQVTEVQPHN